MANVADRKIKELLGKVDEVIKDQKQLEKKEEVIISAVTTEEKEGKEIETKVAEVEDLTTANTLQKVFLKRAKKHQFLFPLVIITGVVLVWRGLWGIFDQLPIVSYYAVSLLLGVALLWIFNKMKSL